MNNCPICNIETDDYGWCDDCAKVFPNEHLSYLHYSMAEWAANRAREFEKEKVKVLMDEIERLKKMVGEVEEPIQQNEYSDEFKTVLEKA